ncbi:hypothetical protein OPV22_003290 [Ensete ventricosum]|uniref:Uncharacterized protein n=1 Tax=Ensete ventricosum TaxID=4639 RepID=A0AAV8S0H5_ENSVE|nr:hypothetical protein OPV22_003290 [Ensete ventricosum]
MTTMRGYYGQLVTPVFPVYSSVMAMKRADLPLPLLSSARERLPPIVDLGSRSPRPPRTCLGKFEYCVVIQVNYCLDKAS